MQRKQSALSSPTPQSAWSETCAVSETDLDFVLFSFFWLVDSASVLKARALLELALTFPPILVLLVTSKQKDINVGKQRNPNS